MNEFRRVRRIFSTEAKLRLLYLLDRLGCATREQLWLLVGRLNLMEYIPCCEALQELCEAGALWAPNGLQGMLALTADGYTLLNTLMRQMPRSERVQMDAAAQEYRRELDEEQNCNVYHEAPCDGLCSVRCKVSDNGEEWMELWIRSADAAVTNRVAESFRKRASLVMRMLYLLPVEDGRNVEVLPAAEALEQAWNNPGKPYCAEKEEHYSGVIRLISEETDRAVKDNVLIRLWENDWPAACAFAASASVRGARLAGEIIRLLCQKDGADTP